MFHFHDVLNAENISLLNALAYVYQTRPKHDFYFSLLLFKSLKVEYDKLANEKTEMQRHYVMVRAAVVKL